MTETEKSSSTLAWHLGIQGGGILGAVCGGEGGMVEVYTLYKPSTLNPKPKTLNPKPKKQPALACFACCAASPSAVRVSDSSAVLARVLS